MAQFTNTTIDDLKNQLNIVDVIGRVVPLKRSGSNYKGICPFHNEKTPSFVVSEQKQIFTCFGCGVSGNVIEFTKRYYNLEFREACEKLGRENGIEISFGNPIENKKREEYYDINRMAARFFYKAFSESVNPGYTYMKSRGFDDAILKKFGVGYADSSWDSLYNHLIEKGIEEKKLLELGLISGSGDKYFDKFRNRVIFPIINTSGRVIGFGGRRVDEKDNPKYLNSPENLIFSKRNNLYGINTTKQFIAKEGNALIVEGYMDVISLFQYGIYNVTATLGTALTMNQAKLLKRYTKNISLCYDSDEAGRNAALRGIDILEPSGLNVKVFHVTDGKDPDDYAKTHGRKAFLELVNEASTAAQYKLDAAAIGIDTDSDEGKLEYLRKATRILKGLSPVEADIYIGNLAKSLKVSEIAIRREMEGIKTDRKQLNDTKKNEKIQDDRKLSTSECSVIKAVVTDPSLTEHLYENTRILSSPLAIKIINIIFELYESNNTFTKNQINDRLEPEESSDFETALKTVLIAGREDEVLRDCILKWKLDELDTAQNDIIEKMNLADESEVGAEITEKLTKELLDIQNKIKELRGIWA